MRCWYTRWQMSNALERGDLSSRMTRGHAARCAACQAFGAQLASLHDRLASGAHLAARPVVAHRPRWAVRIAVPLAAVAAAVAITVGVSTGDGPVVAPVASPVQEERAPAGANPVASVDRIATRLSQVLERSPLEAELDALIHDGRRGLDAILATGGLRLPRRAAHTEDRRP
jgi:hypothetical protein